MTKHILRFRQKSLDLSTPRIMGVLNVTPDSFSDGGKFSSIDNALNHAKQMLSWGVDIIDIGGESTRPNAAIVSTDEELDRVVPVVEAIRAEFGDDVWLSLDTSSPAVMSAGISAGADIINDVRALRRDGAKQTAAALSCPVIIMHSRGEPTTMNDLAAYGDTVFEVIDELKQEIQQTITAGVQRHNIIIDVGMGFAKKYDHHIALMRNLDKIITHFDLPMLFGVSRKRFLGEILSTFSAMPSHMPIERDIIGTVAHLLALQSGANIVRVHDVASMAQAIKMWQLVK